MASITSPVTDSTRPLDDARAPARRRTLSVRVLVVSLVLVAAAAPSVYALRNWQLARTATAYLDRATELEQKKEWLSAADYISRYLALRPRDADAEVRLAETFAKGADTPARISRAVALYYAALSHDLADRQWPLRQKLVDLLLKSGRFAEAETESRKILAHDPASPEADKALAVALFGRIESGSFSSATSAELKKLALLATIDQARRKQPKDVELAVIHASLLRGHPELARAEQPQWKEAERHQNADRCLDELIAADPINPAAWLARFGYRQQFAQAGAEEDIAKALALAPQDPAVLAAAGANELVQARRRKAAGGPVEEVRASAAKAVVYFQALLSAQPASKNPVHQEALGEAQLLSGKPEEAIATWQAGVKRFAGAELLFEARLAEAFLDLDRRKEAEQILAQIDQRIDEARVRLSGKQLAALTAAQDFRRARLAYQARDFAAAIPQLLRVAARAQAAPSASDDAVKALVMLGQSYAALGQWREAGQAYDDACQRNPRLAQVRLAAAQSWLAAGRTQLAAERAEESLSLADSTAAWLTLATAICREQLALAPAARNWDRFELTLAETRKRNEASPLSQPWQVELLQFDALLAQKATAYVSGQKRAPRQVLEDLQALYPADAELWAKLSLAWQRLEMPAEADRSVVHLRSLPEGERLAAQTQVRLHWARKEHQQAEEIVARLVADVPAAQRSGLVREWINFKLARGDVKGARGLLEKEHDLQPGDMATLKLLAELEIQAGRWAQAQKWEQQLSRLPHPADLHARVLKTRRLLAGAKFPGDAAFIEAEKELKGLRDQAPAWGEVAALAGAVAQQRRNWDEAVNQYSRAVALGERRLTLFENLIAVLEKLGRLSEAQEYLQKLESQIPLSQTLTELQGTVEMRLDQPERALAMARKAVEQRPQAVEPRLWLARLLTMHDQPDDAEAELKEALKVAPSDTRVLGALQLFYVRAQRPEAATQLARRIQEQQDLPESERYFVAAQGFELAGKRDLAEESYRRAAAAAPGNAAIQFRMAEFYVQSDSRQAQPCLEKVLELDPAHRGARRMLAILLASRGSDEDWAQAQSLLESQRPDEDAAADARLHAALLARRSGKENLERSQKLLEQLIAQAPHSLPLDRLLLAQVYERQAFSPVDKKTKAKKLELARRELEALASRAQTDWSHFTTVIEFCQRRQDAAGVRNWLAGFQRWMTQQEKPSVEAVLQLVRLQLKHQESADSGEWLERLEAMQADPLTVLLLRAQWLGQQGRSDELRQRVDARGEELLVQERGDAGKTRILSGIAAIYRALEQLPDAERWERRLAAVDPARYEGLATTLTQQGKWREAVDLCRRAAESDKSARPALVALSCLSRTQITDEKVADCEPLIQTALHYDKDNPELHYAIGVMRVVQKRTDDAIASFRLVVKANPRHVTSLNNLALLLSEKGQTKEALEMIDRAIDLAGMIPDLCDTKGTILIMAGDAGEAVRFLEIATSGAKVDPRYEFHLALAFYEQGNHDAAQEHFQKAIEQDLEKQILTEWDVRKLGQLRRNLPAGSEA